MKRVYLDWNATAPLLQSVKTAIIEGMDTFQGNASSIHQDGQKARSLVEKTRRKTASVLNAPAQSVVFTGGATEANNQVIRDHFQKTQNPVLACLSTEHPSVLEVVKEFAKGQTVHLLEVDRSGLVDWENLSLEPAPTFLSCMFANNETGVLGDLGSARKKADEWGAVFHVDATQGVGREKVDFEAIGADFMTASFHKMGGPKGVGVVVIKEGQILNATIAGGHQERGRRPGTENLTSISGLLAALQDIEDHQEEWKQQTIKLREIFLECLQELSFEIRGSGLKNTLNLAFGIDGEDVLIGMDLAGVSASSGSACTAGSLDPSHVILAMGYEEKDARESVRFSFGAQTTELEIRHAAGIIVKTVQRLKSL